MSKDNARGEWAQRREKPFLRRTLLSATGEIHGVCPLHSFHQEEEEKSQSQSPAPTSANLFLYMLWANL